jgi:hypothetical protein
MPKRLILCGGARRPSRDSTLRLALSGPSQNITLRLEDISRMLVRNVPGLLIDLIEIATYVYCADQAISRGGEVQRENGFSIPASCLTHLAPAPFRRRAVARLFREHSG